MMTGNPHSAAKSRVASFSFAYPGSSFKYPTKVSTDDSQKEANLLSVVATILQSDAANTTSSVSSDKPTNGSLAECATANTDNNVSEEVPSAGCSPRQRKRSFLKFDETCSLLKEDILKPQSPNQDQLLSENVDAEGSQKVKTSAQQTWHTVSCKETKNGPKKIKTKSASE